MKRSRAGSVAAFEVLVRDHEAPAHAIARTLLGDADDAADAVQDAFVRAWSSLHALEPGSLFGPWFRAILRNLCLDRLRSPKRRATSHGHARSGANSWSEPEGERRAARSELRAALRAGLDELSPEHRIVLVLRELEEMDYSAIAKTIGVPPGTVASRLHHARTALRSVLERRGVTPEDMIE